MTAVNLFRVVGIQSDGTRVVLATHLRRERAQAIVDALSETSSFSSFRIEPQPDSIPEIDQVRDA